MISVAALIPAYNEADRITETVIAARALEGVSEVVVIDDGSTDDTAEKASSAGADRVVRLEKNSGKGAALMAGVKSTEAEIVLMLDADLASSASAAGALLEPVLSGQVDMTIAVLPSVKGSGGFGFAVKLSRWGIRKSTGHVMKAPLSGQRALKREIIQRMGGFDPGFGVETGLTIDAFKMGYTVEEVPVEISHRTTGKSVKGFIHRGKQFKDIFRALVVRWLGLRKYAPDKNLEQQ
ncbi:MAG TPA: glycosyltransferase family 2 protein [Armatimonadota bacterium]|nr:glycosyltransferase family 2 protein [Armatimonadota bacterium]